MAGALTRQISRHGEPGEKEAVELLEE